MNKEQIFAAFAPVIHEEPIKALDGATLRFKELSGTARDELYRGISGDNSNSNYEAAVIAASVVDESGEPVFTEDDVQALRQSRAAALEEVSRIAMRVNNIGAAAEDTAAKN
ncbi:phage tail assembly chaperone family protein, TAC [Burkholderia ubonensis]|uniref:phage tail assembly chaperone family protein, TAC n=1 Tax=Burkholderia ubonensis TaxID=101571 RepID=UPI000752C1B4|nr:phage tail assembly chaperone family protein, TAC [Burkholderia ubonensis]